MAVTQFVTQFTHVSRGFRVENKENCFGDTVLKILFQICEKNGLFVHKTTFRRTHNKKKEEEKNIKPSTIFGGFLGQN